MRGMAVFLKSEMEKEGSEVGAMKVRQGEIHGEKEGTRRGPITLGVMERLRQSGLRGIRPFHSCLHVNG